MATADSTQRTNSLAFAKQDCHTCSRLNDKCDRRRPKCGTCLSHQRDCGGFALDLVWKDAARPEKQQPRTRDPTSSRAFTPKPIQPAQVFKIVDGRPRKRSKLKKSASKVVIPFTGQLDFSDGAAQYSHWETTRMFGPCKVHDELPISSPSNESIDEISEGDEALNTELCPCIDGALDAQPNVDAIICQNFETDALDFLQCTTPDGELFLGQDHFSDQSSSEMDHEEEHDMSLSVRPSTVLFENLAQKYSPLLWMCTYNFSL